MRSGVPPELLQHFDARVGTPPFSSQQSFNEPWMAPFLALPRYKPEHVPAHPSLTLVANSENAMSHRWSRRLITMQKTAAYTVCSASHGI
jgi:hypothetical protein